MSSIASGVGNLVSGVGNLFSNPTSAITDTAAIAAAPATGGTSLLALAPAIASAGAAGLSYIGSQQTNEDASQNVTAQEAFQQASINQQEQYQSQMADTTYQRGVSDLEAAGLNPMLATSVGGDPAPSGASASGSVAPVVNSIGNAMQAGLSNFSAVQSAMQNAAQIDQTRSQINLNNALIAKAAADTTSALSAADNASANAAATKAGSWTSDLIGSQAASKTSQWVNSAVDAVNDGFHKLGGLIDGVSNSSAYKSMMSYFH